MDLFFPGCIDYASVTADRPTDSNVATRSETKYTHSEGSAHKECIVSIYLWFSSCHLGHTSPKTDLWDVATREDPDQYVPFHILIRIFLFPFKVVNIHEALKVSFNVARLIFFCSFIKVCFHSLVFNPFPHKTILQQTTLNIF